MAAAVDLRPTRQTGPYEKASEVPLRLVNGKQRPRSDERHLAGKDVEKLRQLVQAEPAQPAPDEGGSLAVGNSPAGPVVRVRHRTEFQQPEGVAEAAGTQLPEKRREADVENDSHSDQREKGSRKHEQDCGGGGVNATLCLPVWPVEDRFYLRVVEQRGHLARSRRPTRAGIEADQLGDQAELDVAAPLGVEKRLARLRREFVEGHHHGDAADSQAVHLEAVEHDGQILGLAEDAQPVGDLADIAAVVADEARHPDAIRSELCHRAQIKLGDPVDADDEHRVLQSCLAHGLCDHGRMIVLFALRQGIQPGRNPDAHEQDGHQQRLENGQRAGDAVQAVDDEPDRSSRKHDDDNRADGFQIILQRAQPPDGAVHAERNENRYRYGNRDREVG